MDTGLVQSGLVWLLLKLRTTLEWSRGPAIHPPSSSRVALNVIFNFIPKVLLGGSTGTVTPGMAGMDSRGNVLLDPHTGTGRAKLPARERPTALPQSPESLQRVFHRNLRWGMKGEKSHHQLPTRVHADCLTIP